MDIRVPTPSSQPERDQPQDLMETDKPSTASNNPKKETQSIPQDPDARKVFIQQVSGAHEGIPPSGMF